MSKVSHMKASEWIQSVEKQVIQDKVVPNKPVKLFGSSLVSLNREYFLLLLSQVRKPGSHSVVSNLMYVVVECLLFD